MSSSALAAARGWSSIARHDQIVCHICNWRGAAPRWCPVCEGDRLRLWGYGSEAVAEAVAHLLPRAVVARIDSDRPVNEWMPTLRRSSAAQYRFW